MATSDTTRRYMTIAELENSDRGPVFVLNTATAPEGKIILGIMRKNGIGQDPVRIPKTFIPIDLTHQVPRSQLLDSSDFRRTINGGLIKLVTPEFATLILSTEEGKAEKLRIDNELSAVVSLLENESLSGKDIEGTSAAEQRVSEIASAARPGRDLETATGSEIQALLGNREKGKPGQRVEVIIADAAAEQWEGVKIVSELKRYGTHKLNKQDFKLLSSTYGQNSATPNAKVFKFLREAYAARKDDL